MRSRASSGTAASKVVLTADHSTVLTDWNDIAFVKAAISDASGGVVTGSSAAVTFAIAGPGVIVAVDSGSMTEETFRGNVRKAYQGLAFALVQATGAGTITVTASATGLTGGASSVQGAKGTFVPVTRDEVKDMLRHVRLTTPPPPLAIKDEMEPQRESERGRRPALGPGWMGTWLLMACAGVGALTGGCDGGSSGRSGTSISGGHGDSGAESDDASFPGDTSSEAGTDAMGPGDSNARSEADAPAANGRDATNSSDAADDGTLDADSASPIPAPAGVLAIMEQAATYQIAAGPGAGNADWVNKWTESVFYMGVMATYDATKNATYLTAASSWGARNDWTLLDGTTNPPTRDADDQSAGQVYSEIYMLDPVTANAGEIKNTQASIDAMIAKPNPGHVDWWWCDSFFMAPPLVVRLGAISGQSKYDSFLDSMWSDASAALFDRAHGLFWRDSTFVGSDTYWSRGNGWVMGGIVRILEDLPATDPGWSTYSSLLETLAASVAPLQGSDGLWRSDLLHPGNFPNPETSGTALFTFAMAWGIHHGILDRDTYLPIVLKGWAGLVANVTPQGRLEYVQGTGSAPAAATAADSYDYGVGTFLLAGSEVAQLP
jgi:unsaturated rhamnogalacturonyl hydrolase